MIHCVDSSRNLPQGWTLKRLGEVCTVHPGQHVLESDYNETGIGVGYLTGPADFGPSHPSISKWTRQPKAWCQAGDVLVTVKGAGVGKANLAPREPVAIGRQLMAVRPKTGLVEQGFIYFLIQSRFLTLQSRALGSTVPGLKREHIESLPVVLPPLPEQRRIVSILNEQLAAVERARAAAAAALDAAKALAAATFRQAFHGIVPLSTSKQPSSAPGGWKWRLLTDVAKLESGHTPSRDQPDWWGGQIPWIALPDIREMDGKIALETKESTNQLGIENSSARILPKGTVVLSRTASVGFVTIMGREMATSQDFVNWVCGPELDPHFLALLLQAARNYIRSLSSGAIHNTVYMKTVKGFRVCIPPQAEQRRIADRLRQRVECVERLVNSIQQEVNAVHDLPSALLRIAFNGEL